MLVQIFKAMYCKNILLLISNVVTHAHLKLHSQRSFHFSEQMFADKYPSMFSRQKEAIVYIIVYTQLAASVINYFGYIN